MTEAHEWLSAHVYFGAPIYSERCDRVILDIVAPFAEECVGSGKVDRYFFIRYSERGPHVRFRLYGRPRTLRDEIAPALAEHVERASAEEGAGGGLRLEWVAYEPEYERYGGVDGVALAEWCFHASSDAAIALLREMRPGDHSSRLGKGLLAMLVMVHAFFPEPGAAALFAQQYATGYLHALTQQSEDRRALLLASFGKGYERQAERLSPYIEQAWTLLSTSESLSPALDPYAARCRELRSRFCELARAGRLERGGRALRDEQEAARAIVPSYVHMTSNRLGVSIPEEAYLSYIIRRNLLGGEAAPLTGEPSAMPGEAHQPDRGAE